MNRDSILNGRFPDFMIIGAMKSGTTSLHDYLGKHPDIFMSKQKEIHYFADNNFYKYDAEWYKNHFVTNKKIAGTSPQNYTKCHNKYYKNIPERIKNYIPEIKFIYILRDPIERYRSHILENYYGEPRHDVEYNISIQHYEKTGMYYMQLCEYLKYFKMDQIHILTLEELKKHRLRVLNEVFVFLGLEKLENEDVFNFVSNNHESKVLPDSVINTLAFRILNKVAPKQAQNVSRSKLLKKYIFTKGEKKYLSGSEIMRLKEIYSEDVSSLRKLTGRSFSDWSV